MDNSSNLRSWGLTVLRVVVGIVFLVHGSQKLFTFGFHGVAGMFGSMGVPMPAVSAVVVTLVEFLGGLALIFGIVTRVAAALLAIDMLGAIIFVHGKHGFSMQSGGFEYPLTLLAANICLMLAGPGALAVQSLFGRNKI